MKISVSEILSGRFLTLSNVKKQFKLIALVAVLVFFYVWAGISAQRQHHRMTEMKKQLEDSRFTLMTIHAEEVELTRQSSISQALREKGSRIKECVVPVTYLKSGK